jgi:hypothetical protein
VNWVFLVQCKVQERDLLNMAERSSCIKSENFLEL